MRCRCNECNSVHPKHHVHHLCIAEKIVFGKGRYIILTLFYWQQSNMQSQPVK